MSTRLQRATEKAPVFRIARHAARRHTDDATGSIVRRGARIVRRDQHGLDAELREVGAERADRSGDAVDARKVDVGDEQYPHAAPMVDSDSDAPIAPLTAPNKAPTSTSVG